MTDFQEKLLETLDAIRKELIIMNTADDYKQAQRDVFEEIELLNLLYTQRQHAIRDNVEEEIASCNKRIEDTKTRLRISLKYGMVTK